LEDLQEGLVTFRYRDNKTQALCHTSITAEEFIGRFLQHVLPKGFVKVRAYGLWSCSQKEELAKIQQELQQTRQPQPLPAQPTLSIVSRPEEHPIRCPQCKTGSMRFICKIAPERKWPP
jgi:Putative transposase